jgi:hypothetical protein
MDSTIGFVSNGSSGKYIGFWKERLHVASFARKDRATFSSLTAPYTGAHQSPVRLETLAYRHEYFKYMIYEREEE